MSLEKTRINIESMLIMATGGVEVAFHQVGRADSRILNTWHGRRFGFPPELARQRRLAQVEAQGRHLVDDFPRSFFRRIGFFEENGSAFRAAGVKLCRHSLI